MLDVNLKLAKSMFFDRVKIKKSVDVRTRKVLSKFGAYVRRTSRQSIKKRKDTSVPGRPPFSHTGILKKFIFFGYDTTKRSVVIGPIIAPGKPGKAPATLEHGGKVSLPLGNKADMAARPFMKPAFQREIKTLPSTWANTIK